MGELLLDAQVRTRYAWFSLHDSDLRYGGTPDEGDPQQVVETMDGVAILLGDLDSEDEVPVRVRVLRGPADGDGDLVFEKGLFLYGTGLVVENGFPSVPHVVELGGPGRVPVRVFLDVTTSPPAVTVVLGELVPDRSVLPPVPLRERLGRWFRSRS